MKPLVNIYFSGAGLMDLGLNRAGMQVQQSFELDEDCCAVARRNFSHEIVRCDMAQKLVAGEKDCDAMGATFPCTKYSAIGDVHGVRTGDELFLHYFRHLAIKRPELYWMENVPGMRKFPVVMEAMTQLPDYYINVFCPVKTETWLPQRRDRLIIIGSKRRFNWREPVRGRRVRLRDIIETDAPVKLPKYAVKRLRGGYRDRPIISDPARDDLAPTCVAHYARDCSTRLVADRRSRHGARAYTVREYARLQGVPDNFEFPVSDAKAFRMIGNGVPVPMGEWLGREFLRYFRR